MPAGDEDRRRAEMNRGQGRRIARAVQGWEGFCARDQRRGPNHPQNPGVLRARVTTPIPTGTWSSPSGSGAVQVYHLDQSGEWAAEGDPATCYNQFALDADVAVDTACFVAWISGQLWLVNAECPEP